MYEIAWKNGNGITNSMTVGSALAYRTERDRIGIALLAKTELQALTDIPDIGEHDIQVTMPDGKTLNYKDAMAHISELTQNSEEIDRNFEMDDVR